MTFAAAPSDLTRTTPSIYPAGGGISKAETLNRRCKTVRSTLSFYKERKLISDEELIAQFKEGDLTAFDLLVERYQQQAYRIAYQIVSHREDAKDLSQQAFLRIYEGVGAFRGASRFYTWFYRILVNLCLDHLRRRSLLNRFFRFFPANDPDKEDSEESIHGEIQEKPDWGNPERCLVDKEFRLALQKALAMLSPQQRAVFLFRNNHDLSIQEIGEILGTSEGTVKTHLFRAVRLLRKKLSDFK
jgi:RNA polymerase sigma-70 factor (ECF subfamily)